jgi:hypothetical protein
MAWVGKLTWTGDMGFSGSTFFTTQDGAYIVKSVPRHFEHSFFKNDLLVPYVEYARNNPTSLLIRTLEFLERKYTSVGSIIGESPNVSGIVLLDHDQGHRLTRLSLCP